MTALDLTSEEQNHVRCALYVARTKLGPRGSLAKALHFKEGTLRDVLNGKFSVSPNMAFRLARLLGFGIDDLLAGRYTEPGICPKCGCSLPEAVMRPSSRGAPS